jgi:hypothetical protein
LGHHAVGGEDIRLAPPHQGIRVVRLQGCGSGESVGRLVIALQHDIGTPQQHPTANIAGLGIEPGAELVHQTFDLGSPHG